MGTKQLKPNAVTSAKVRNASLRPSDFKPGSLPRGAQGERGPTGAPGPSGDTGARGEAGPSEAYSSDVGSGGLSSAGPAPTVAELDLPAGSYVAYGNATFANASMVNAKEVVCSLTTSSEVADSARTRLPPDGATDTLALSGAFRLTGASTTAVLSCYWGGTIDGASIAYTDADVGAVRVATLHP